MRTPRPIRHLAVFLAISLPVLSPPVAAADTGEGAVLRQVGTYQYLTQPDFTGLATVGEIAAGRTIGIGTFANLDGELIMVGGTVYQVRTDGVPRSLDPSTRTPFMQAVGFRPSISVPVAPGTACSDLAPIITRVAERQNGVIAVRVRGTFSGLLTRSVAADPPPFQSLAQTIAEQTTFTLDGRRAVLVGFWQGKDALGIGQDGLHLHGLTADRAGGGHVLSCVAGTDVQLSVQPVSRISVHTP